MPEIRGAAAGSKKRYAGLVGETLEIVGLEAVRRDWSAVARRFQRELLARVLRDEPVDAFVRTFVAVSSWKWRGRNARPGRSVSS